MCICKNYVEHEGEVTPNARKILFYAPVEWIIFNSIPRITSITIKPSPLPLGFAVGVDRVLQVPFWIQSGKSEPHESIGRLNKCMDKHVAQAMGSISGFCRPPLHSSRYPPSCLLPQIWCSKFTNLVHQLRHVY